MNKLFYGDNLEILRSQIPEESVDLCYIDPPFNSKRDYNQIYNNIGGEDKAQAMAFVDTWEWNALAEKEFDEICMNQGGLLSAQTSNLIMGLFKILGRGSLMSYLVSMTLRINEIHRVLKPTGSFYLHCDSTVSHYLKIVLDAVFCGNGGEFRNEINWRRGNANTNTAGNQFSRNSDTIFFYTKSSTHIFNRQLKPYSQATLKMYKFDDNDGRGVYRLQELRTYSQESIDSFMQNNRLVERNGKQYFKQYFTDKEGVAIDTIWEDIPSLQGSSKERLGYPTQKPEKLLERIIRASSNEDSVILDAFCGCGTTVAVAQRLGRKWIGIDITYQSISLIKKRLVESYGEAVLDTIKESGNPKDIEAARALATKQDDRLRKEFEKWALLTYSNNMAMVNEKKGADGGIDGRARIRTDVNAYKDVLFSVKSGKVGVKDIREFHTVVDRENAVFGIFIAQCPDKGYDKRSSRIWHI